MRKADSKRLVLEDSRSEFIKSSAILLDALSHPVRLKVLRHIVENEINVGNLSEIVGLSQPAVSQHLFKLRSLGLVSTRRDAQVVYYSCTSPAVAQMIQTLAEIFPTAEVPVYVSKNIA